MQPQPGGALPCAARGIVLPGNQSGGGAPNNTLVYTGRIINQTGITNSFSLSLWGNTWTTTLAPTQTVSLSTGTSTPYTVTVAIPACQAQGSHDAAHLLVSSDLPSPGTYTATVQISTTVTTNGADFNPAAASRAGLANSTVVYTSTLTNNSGTSTRYTLSPAGNTFTTTIVPTDTGTLANGAHLPITVSVQIPAVGTARLHRCRHRHGPAEPARHLPLFRAGHLHHHAG